MALGEGYIRGYIAVRLFFLSSYKSNFHENSYMDITVIEFLCVSVCIIHWWVRKG